MFQFVAALVESRPEKSLDKRAVGLIVRGFEVVRQAELPGHSPN